MPEDAGGQTCRRPSCSRSGERLQLIYEFRISAETPVSTQFASMLTASAVAEDGQSLSE